MTVKEMRELLEEMSDDATVMIYFDTKPFWRQARVSKVENFGERVLISFEGPQSTRED